MESSIIEHGMGQSSSGDKTIILRHWERDQVEWEERLRAAGIKLSELPKLTEAELMQPATEILDRVK